MEIHMLEHQVTEDMLGILSARILRKEPKKNCQESIYMIS